MGAGCDTRLASHLDPRSSGRAAELPQTRLPGVSAPKSTPCDRRRPLWTPSADRIAGATITRFMRAVESRFHTPVPDYPALYRFSIDQPEDFWRLMWEFGGVIGNCGFRVVDGLDRMPGATFFPDATLNFAENLLRRGRDDRLAVVFRGEGGTRRSLTLEELRRHVAAFAAALRRADVRAGDRVAGYPAESARDDRRGARRGSCRRGVVVVLARLRRRKACSTASAKSSHGCSSRLTATSTAASDTTASSESRPWSDAIASIEHAVVVPYLNRNPALPSLPNAHLWEDFVADSASAELDSSRFHSIIPSTSSTPRAPRACRSASFTAPAER